MKKPVLLIAYLFCFSVLNAQTVASAYPSLLWEITGNGLARPSYLFGTMHVSNKMVFHLSDSFYHAIAACDMVSLEVDPKEWQPDMFGMQKAQLALSNYISNTANEYINEKSFRLTGYEDKLKTALSEEPMAVNGLLYRNFSGQADFQENTYLDLYIYQTARKLGKSATGVENYITSEEIQLEANLEAMKETRKPRYYTQEDNPFQLQQIMQEAYRKGDLSLLDSLNKKTTVSEAYNEKFLYGRNNIQANSIDSILKHHSLFVAVGAAHLPGERGVIEILRRKGYILRPVQMSDQDAVQKEKIDKLKVPVVMNQQSTPDGFVSVKLPGELFRRPESSDNESYQYADMENGSYYMLTRVKTHAPMLGETTAAVMKKIESLLYEYIPGKIIEKTSITKNGYEGLNIINKNRRGDLQRYNIFVLPYEILIFKMSGNDDYVSGNEAGDFFNSISIGHLKKEAKAFSPSYGGFSATFPSEPFISFNKSPEDRLAGWQYEASSENGDAFMLVKKNVQTQYALEEDTLNLKLLEASIKSSELFKKETSRNWGKNNNYSYLDMTFELKDGGSVRARGISNGADYYLLMTRNKEMNSQAAAFFKSFELQPLKYGNSIAWKDTALKFSTRSPVVPVIDNKFRSYIDKTLRSFTAMTEQTYNGFVLPRVAMFKNDSTGEAVLVSVSAFPKYEYRTDSAKFWKDQLNFERLSKDFIITGKHNYTKPGGLSAYLFTLKDTANDNEIKKEIILAGDHLYQLSAIKKTGDPETAFIKDFFQYFQPELPPGTTSIFSSKTVLIFKDIYSADSLTRKTAREALNFITFRGKELPLVQQAISKLRASEPEYISLKYKLINALGKIDDSLYSDKVAEYLYSIFKSTADTAVFQNAAISSLSRLKSKKAYTFLAGILPDQPPMYENQQEAAQLFRSLSGDTALAKILLPGVLQLTSIDDYKQAVYNFLFTLSDSAALQKKDYAPAYTQLYFEVQSLLKKQQLKEQRKEQNAGTASASFDDNQSRFLNAMNVNSRVTSFAQLLIPFYDEKAALPKLFNDLLHVKDTITQVQLATLLLKNNKPVPDSVITAIAAKDAFRIQLYNQLKKIGKQNLIPDSLRSQEAMARALLIAQKSFQKIVKIENAGKQFISFKNQNGWVYFFKYQLDGQPDWMAGISGIQPEKITQVNANNYFANTADIRLKSGQPEMEQFQTLLNRTLLTKTKTGMMFFANTGFVPPSIMLR
ncbi:MAG: lipoprotein [Chitinophagaceae bacterium]|nr:lipoprotein [Chitinophagaceae bacterium]